MTAAIEYLVSKSELRRLAGRAYRAQQRDQSEVCGALIQTSPNHLKLEFLRNAFVGPCSFKINAEDLRMARLRARGHGHRVAGSFHSHPISEAIPGAKDIELAPIRSLILIYDVCGRQARLWRVVRNKAGKTVSERRLIISAAD